MFGHDDENQNNQSSTTVDPGAGQPLDSATPVISSIDPPADTHDGDDMHTAPVADDAAPSAPAADKDELLNLKRDALSQLAPLVGHLDQTPDEKFKTTMMMIQATDDSGLIKDAFQAAKDIPDDKGRAQALLDIVNEINYFTQHNAE